MIWPFHRRETREEYEARQKQLMFEEDGPERPPATWLGTPEFAAFVSAYREAIERCDQWIAGSRASAKRAANDVIDAKYFNYGDIDRALDAVRAGINGVIFYRAEKAHFEDMLRSYENGQQRPSYLPALPPEPAKQGSSGE